MPRNAKERVEAAVNAVSDAPIAFSSEESDDHEGYHVLLVKTKVAPRVCKQLNIGGAVAVDAALLLESQARQLDMIEELGVELESLRAEISQLRAERTVMEGLGELQSSIQQGTIVRRYKASLKFHRSRKSDAGGTESGGFRGVAMEDRVRKLNGTVGAIREILSGASLAGEFNRATEQTVAQRFASEWSRTDESNDLAEGTVEFDEFQR